MTTWYNISSYVQDPGGINLMVDIHNEEGFYLYANQPTGKDSQLWQLILDPKGSGYFFFQSKWADPSGKNVVIDIHDDKNISGTLLDGFPRKSTKYDNQLWKTVADVSIPGYGFIESIMTDPAGVPLVVDIQGDVNKVNTPLDAFSKKSSKFDNQLWTLVPVS